MTYLRRDEVLDARSQALWRDQNMRVREIAERLGVNVSILTGHATRNRDRFPIREFNAVGALVGPAIRDRAAKKCAVSASPARPPVPLPFAVTLHSVAAAVRLPALPSAPEPVANARKPVVAAPKPRIAAPPIAPAHRCQWITHMGAHGRGWRFCDAPSVGSWCPTHRAVVFIPSRRREDVAA